MNILGPRLDGCRWLDLCSGSGVMACEALQHGAEMVVAVENHPATARICTKNVQTIRDSLADEPQIKVIRQDVVHWLQRDWNEPAFDLVYFDPPYDADLYSQVIHQLSCGGWLNNESLVICEHRSRRTPVTEQGWTVKDQRKYGISSLLMLSPPERCRPVDTGSMPPQKDPKALLELNPERCHTGEVRS
jgi:16S rRNA (guanine(966)-N(2))-methyltransferase RsmD